MKNSLFLFSFIFLSNSIAQITSINDSILKPLNLTFKLLDSSTNSNIDYLKFKNINQVPGGITLLESTFLVDKPGKYTVFRYIANEIGCVTHECESLDTKYWLVMFKTNKRNRIVDGYFYYLSESELPRNSWLYKMRRKNLYNTNDLVLGSFNFYSRGCKDRNNRTLSPELNQFKIIK